MKSKELMPSEILQEFLSRIDYWQKEYKTAYEKVGIEDKRLHRMKNSYRKKLILQMKWMNLLKQCVN